MSANELDPGLQIILQRPDGGNALCEGFGGIPSIHPAYIGIESDGTSAGDRDAEVLGREMRRRILAMPGATQQRPPCGGFGGPMSCFALGKANCRKVAVTVCSGAQSVSPKDMSHYGNGKNIVCFPWGTDAASILPSYLDTNTAATWQHSVYEVVNAIFAAVQLTTAEARLFISYRQKEALDLSEQLFEELGKKGFDVFVDRFRGTPGSNFQRRILEEIAHKSMVLFLETATIASAPWTKYEIAVAKSLRVGLLALLVPGGVPIGGIDNNRRITLQPSDFVPNTQTLTTPAMDAVIDRIGVDHTLNEMRRRQLLRDNMRRALARENVYRQDLVGGGLLSVLPSARSSKSYLVHLPVRPADLSDYYEVAHDDSTPEIRTIVAPANHFRDVRREQMRWLGKVSDVRAFDEGAMLDVAKRIKAETL